jgi:transposase
MSLPHFIPTGSHVGVDVSKDWLDVAVHETGKVWRCRQTPDDHAKLAAFLARHEVRLVLMEASGRYGHALCRALHLAGVRLRVDNPARVRNFARSTGTVAKTDRIDAVLLARMAAVLMLEPHAHVSERQMEMADLATRRNQLKTMWVAEKARLDPMPRCSLIRDQIETHMQQLNEQIAQIEARLDELITADKRLSATRDMFEAVAGVGPQTTRVLLACMPEIGQLNRREVGALAGVSPVTNQSGKSRAATPIGKGREQVRRALYMAALSAARHNDHLRAFYKRMRQNDLKPKQALIAVARKLLVHLNSLAAQQHRAFEKPA